MTTRAPVRGKSETCVGTGRYIRKPSRDRAAFPRTTPRNAQLSAKRAPLTGFCARHDIFPVSNDAAREKYKAYLATKGLRVTNQRLAIFDAAFAQKEHFTAEELLEYARAIDDSVSRATVYRSIPIMTESALLREVDIGKNLKYYRPNTDNNSQVAQVICLDCDRIFEISAPFMEWYGNTVSAKLNLTPVSQRLQVSAHCNILRETGVCKNRSAN